MGKKILFITNTLGQGGAEVALLELLHALAKKPEFSLSLYVLLEQGELISRLPKEVKLLGDHYSKASVLSHEGRCIYRKRMLELMFAKGLIFKRFSYLIRNFWKMYRNGKVWPYKLGFRILADGAKRFNETYDVAIAYLEGAATYYLADYVNAKYKIAWLHIDYQSAGYSKQLDLHCYDKIDQIYTVSDEIRAGFLAVYPECAQRCQVFPNLLDPNRIRVLSREHGGFCDGFQGFRILTIARLTYAKGLDVNIEAMRLLKEAGIWLRWYVLGEGDLRRSLEKQIKEAGLIGDFILLGNKANPYPYIRQSDVYVQASRFEGKSIAVQEAQILHKAIIVSDCPGNREQVVDGSDGLIVPLEASAIATAIQKVLQDSKQRAAMGLRAGERNFFDKHTFQTFVEALKR